jgi:hypothetical protein
MCEVREILFLGEKNYDFARRFPDLPARQYGNDSVDVRVLKKTPWLWSASELCRPSDRRLILRMEGVAWSAQRIPPVVSLGFLEGIRILKKYI